MNPATTQRFVRDGALIVSQNLPAAGAANATASLDLGNPPGRIVDDFDVILEVPATPSLVDAHAITLTVKDSPDGITFTAIPALAPQTITGAGGLGGPVFSMRLKLPDTANRYIRLDASVAAGGGDNAALSTTLSLAF